MALFEDVSHAKHLRLPSVTFMSDALNVVKAINTRDPPMEAYEIINDIVSLVHSFYLITFAYVPRGENKQVDEFAKSVLRSMTMILEHT